MLKTLLYPVRRLAAEPPLRIISRALLRKLSTSIETRALWDLSARPAYLLGMAAAAAQARKQHVREIAIVEFGVAGGSGLIVMEQEAEAVERETGVGMKVFGFDMGPGGLPRFIGDYRDHPEEWLPGDFPMDVASLESRLTERTTLVLGNIKETVPTFFEEHRPPPIGFVAIDLDLYSSTRDALQILSLAGKRMLWHTPMYFDDIADIFNHQFAGELLAIAEFNAVSEFVKIDRWHGVRSGRPFPERAYLEQMYVAHDLEGASRAILDRRPGSLPLEQTVSE